MTRTLQTVLDEANANKLHTAMHMLPAGRAISLVPKFFRGAVAADALVLPTTAKAHAVLAATATIGGAVGHLLPVAPGAAPAAGNVRLDINGDQARFAVADAVTKATLVYVRVPTTTVDAKLRSAVDL